MARPKKNPDAAEEPVRAVKPRAGRPKTTKVTTSRAKKAAASTKTLKVVAKPKTAGTKVVAKPVKKSVTKAKSTTLKTRKSKPAEEKAVKAAVKKPAKTQASVKKAAKSEKATRSAAKTKKTTKPTAKKSTARSVKAAETVEVDAGLIVAAVPRRRGRPPKQKPEIASEPEVPVKPGLVSMTPATKVRPTRGKGIKTAVAKKNEAKVARVQQEQILAEELNQKVINSEPGLSTAKGRAAARKAAVAARKATATAANTPVVDLPRKRQAVSTPPATVTARRRRRLAFAVVWFVVLAACLAGGYLYKTSRPVEAAQTADARLLEQVAKRVVLPANETPSISTVVDAKQVNQPFLVGAQNGDKVLLYFQAGRAIVYRPSTGQVVNIGSLQEPEPRVFIRKGSPVANTSKIASTIAASSDFALDSQDTSPVENYTKTIIVDVAGNRPDIANKLATLLHATVAPLPQGETLPDADLLVIVGSDVK